MLENSRNLRFLSEAAAGRAPHDAHGHGPGPAGAKHQEAADGEEGLQNIIYTVIITRNPPK